MLTHVIWYTILWSTQSTMLQFGSRSFQHQLVRSGFQKPFQLQFAHIMQHGHRIIDHFFVVVFVSLYQEHENATANVATLVAAATFCPFITLNHLHLDPKIVLTLIIVNNEKVLLSRPSVCLGRSLILFKICHYKIILLELLLSTFYDTTNSFQ